MDGQHTGQGVFHRQFTDITFRQGIADEEELVYVTYLIVEHVADVLDKFPVHHFSSGGKAPQDMLRDVRVRNRRKPDCPRHVTETLFPQENMLHGIDLGTHEDEGTWRHGIASVGIDNSFQKAAAFFRTVEIHVLELLENHHQRH